MSPDPSVSVAGIAFCGGPAFASLRSTLPVETMKGGPRCRGRRNGNGEESVSAYQTMTPLSGPGIERHPVTGRIWKFPISQWREVFADLEADNKRQDREMEQGLALRHTA
jgi:hypothetical protein